MQDEANMKAPEPAYVVDQASLLIKYRSQLDEATYQRLLAEAAVDELIYKVNRLLGELKEVQAAKDQQEAAFKAQLEDVRGQLEALRESAE